MQRNDLTRDPKPVDTTKFQAAYGVSRCMFGAALRDDPRVFHETTLVKCEHALRTVMEAMAEAGHLPNSAAYWVVLNGTVHVYRMAQPLMRLGAVDAVIPAGLWAVTCMEHILPLMSVRYLPWLGELYVLVYEAYMQCSHEAEAALWLRRSLLHVVAFRQLHVEDELTPVKQTLRVIDTVIGQLNALQMSFFASPLISAAAKSNVLKTFDTQEASRVAKDKDSQAFLETESKVEAPEHAAHVSPMDVHLLGLYGCVFEADGISCTPRLAGMGSSPADFRTAGGMLSRSEMGVVLSMGNVGGGAGGAGGGGGGGAGGLGTGGMQSAGTGAASAASSSHMSPLERTVAAVNALGGDMRQIVRRPTTGTTSTGGESGDEPESGSGRFEGGPSAGSSRRGGCAVKRHDSKCGWIIWGSLCRLIEPMLSQRWVYRVVCPLFNSYLAMSFLQGPFRASSSCCGS